MENTQCTTAVFAFLFILGFSLFVGYWFDLMVPQQELIDRTRKTDCMVDAVRNSSYPCHQKNCDGCGNSVNPLCDTLIHSGSNGPCQENDHCCVDWECIACTIEVCDGVGKDRRCSDVRFPCCDTECVEYGSEQCRITWGTCWNIEVIYHVYDNAYPTYERRFEEHCGFNDRRCVEEVYDRFPQRSLKDCWYDPSEDMVMWSSPDMPDKYWVAAGFGIAFMCIGFIGLLSLCWDYVGRRGVPWVYIERESTNSLELPSINET